MPGSHAAPHNAAWAWAPGGPDNALKPAPRINIRKQLQGAAIGRSFNCRDIASDLICAYRVDKGWLHDETDSHCD